MPMTVTLTASDDRIHIGGIPCRIWDGHTSNGVPVQAVVARIQARDMSCRAAFAAEAEREALEGPIRDETARLLKDRGEKITENRVDQ